MRHHPSAPPTSGGAEGEGPGHAHLAGKGGAEPIDQDLLRKYIVYSKEKVTRQTLDVNDCIFAVCVCVCVCV